MIRCIALGLAVGFVAGTIIRSILLGILIGLAVGLSACYGPRLWRLAQCPKGRKEPST
jgi:hypothetical protein